MKRIFWFLLRNLPKLRRGMGGFVQAIIAEFIISMMWLATKTYLNKKGIDVEKIQQQLLDEIYLQLKKENLRASWGKIHNKGEYFKQLVLRAVKKVVPLDATKEQELNERLQKKATALNELLQDTEKDGSENESPTN